MKLDLEVGVVALTGPWVALVTGPLLVEVLQTVILTVVVSRPCLVIQLWFVDQVLVAQP